MKNEELNIYLSNIEEFFEEGEQNQLYDIFDSLRFKLNKNKYHYDNIKNTIKKADTLEDEEFYGNLQSIIYYEMESFLVSLRSTVDILLHLVNFSFKLGLKDNEVVLYNVYRHKQLPKNVKNIFNRYTKPYNNPTWNFIYTSRNEVVHEKSVNQVLPINVDLFNYEVTTVFFDWEDNPREMITFFGQCIRFLENFSTQFLQSIKLSLR